MKLKRPALIVLCGWPISGKSTIAKIVAERLNEDHSDPAAPKVNWVDIDTVRRHCIGLPYPHPDESAALMKKDGVEMGGAYRLLLEVAKWHLEQRRSLILTATFSRKIGQENLSRIYHDTYGVALRDNCEFPRLVVIQCLPTNDPQEEIERRLFRGFGGDYVGGVNSYKRYMEVKERYEPIRLLHLTLNTSPPMTPEECAEEALAYIITETAS